MNGWLGEWKDGWMDNWRIIMQCTVDGLQKKLLLI